MTGGMVTTVGRLAAEMGVTTEVVLDACRRAGVSTFGAQSPLDDGEVARVRGLLGSTPWAPPDASTASQVNGAPVAPSPYPAPPPQPPGPPLYRAPVPPAPLPSPPGERKLPVWVVALLGVLTAAVVVFGGLVVTGALEDPEPRPFEAVQDVLEEPDDEPGTTTPATGAPGVLDDVLVVGDCWTDPSVRNLVEAPAEASSVAWEEMPCDRPHHAEVYAVAVYPNAPGDPFPGDEALFLMGVELCAPHWEPFVGVPLERSVFDSVLLYPTERSWLIGDREVVCSLYPLDGTLLRSSARGVGR